MSFAVKLLGFTCILLFLASCRWLKPQGASSIDDWNLTPAQRESLSVVFKESRNLKAENEKLKKALRTRDLDIAKYKADLDNQIERNRYLEEVARDTQLDLVQVEKQFVNIEQRLQTTETKASAVAVLAETKLEFDTFRKLNSNSLDSSIISEIRQKLAESDKLIQKKNYAAAVYYANRAHRLLEQSINRKSYHLPIGETRIVSASKVNLRSGPGLDYDVIGNLGRGTILIQLDQKDEWLRIKTKDGNTGWIHRTLLR